MLFSTSFEIRSITFKLDVRHKTFLAQVTFIVSISSVDTLMKAKRLLEQIASSTCLTFEILFKN